MHWQRYIFGPGKDAGAGALAFDPVSFASPRPHE
jgi:hypothetical protein